MEDGGETESEDGGGKVEGAHTALDDEVGDEFAEKCGREAVLSATPVDGGTSKWKTCHL